MTCFHRKSEKIVDHAYPYDPTLEERRCLSCGAVFCKSLKMPDELKTFGWLLVIGALIGLFTVILSKQP